jgi:hypothetical protein
MTTPTPIEAGARADSLRERCKTFYRQMQTDAMLRQGSPVDDLMAFVQSEQGRAADSSLEETKPLILYFGSEADREEMIAVLRMAKPGMITKKMPGGR